MTIIRKFLFKGRCGETTCSNDSIRILIVLKTVFRNYMFEYGIWNLLLNDGFWILLVPITVFRIYLFE